MGVLGYGGEYGHVGHVTMRLQEGARKGWGLGLLSAVLLAQLRSQRHHCRNRAALLLYGQSFHSLQVFIEATTVGYTRTKGLM